MNQRFTAAATAGQRRQHKRTNMDRGLPAQLQCTFPSLQPKRVDARPPCESSAEDAGKQGLCCDGLDDTEQPPRETFVRITSAVHPPASMSGTSSRKVQPATVTERSAMGMSAPRRRREGCGTGGSPSAAAAARSAAAAAACGCTAAGAACLRLLCTCWRLLVRQEAVLWPNARGAQQPRSQRAPTPVTGNMKLIVSSFNMLAGEKTLDRACIRAARSILKTRTLARLRGAGSRRP